MNIQLDNPAITYSDKGKPFSYEKLFLKTVSEYIEEYKNIPYEKLTEKDQSVALARIFKRMECNGIPLKDYFAKEFEKWENLENNVKISKLMLMISKDIFCCFDKNLEVDGEFARGTRIYCVVNEGKRDYIAYQDPVKKGLFAKKNKPTPYHIYFSELIAKCEAGELSKSSVE